MDIAEVTVSAATDHERRDIVDLIAAVAVEIDVSLNELSTTKSARKKAMEFAEVITVVLQGVAAIGSGVIANTIYEKVKAKSKAPERLRKRSTETEIEIIDEQSGARIVVKIRKNEESNDILP